MPRKPDRNVQTALAAWAVFTRLSTRLKVAVVALLLVAAVIWVLTRPRPQPAPPPASTDGYLFCFWNMENLFDDQDDRRNSIDEPYDNAFARNPQLRQAKYDHLAEALVRMNDGRGPDVIAGCEVESVRAAELLRDALNARLDPALRYTQLAMVEVSAGRHIAPCVISRVPVEPGRSRLLGRQLRILESHLTAAGHDLCVVVSHWRSQLPDRDTGGHGEEGRDKYAAAIRTFVDQKAAADPTVDLLVCGDFNDTPEAESVTAVLRATGDRSRVVPGPSPLLLDLMAGKPAEQYGTLWYDRKPLIYDQICVSPGLLDPAGWDCDSDSVRTATDGLMRSGTRREPWRFGNPGSGPTGGRGYSDHFPVTIRLRVSPAGG